eukprot:CFRG1339T1
MAITVFYARPAGTSVVPHIAGDFENWQGVAMNPASEPKVGLHDADWFSFTILADNAEFKFKLNDAWIGAANEANFSTGEARVAYVNGELITLTSMNEDVKEKDVSVTPKAKEKVAAVTPTKKEGAVASPAKKEVAAPAKEEINGKEKVTVAPPASEAAPAKEEINGKEEVTVAPPASEAAPTKPAAPAAKKEKQGSCCSIL